ncbi:Ankyrin-1, partial [Candidatus Magnetomorum sp. HK-1]
SEDSGDEELSEENCWKRSPIELAAKHGNLKIMKYLANNGADINNFVLLAAVENRHIDVVDFLLKLGVDVYHKDEYNEYNALHFAEKHKYWKIADRIRNYIEKNSESFDSKIRKLIHSHFSLKEETNIDQLVKHYSKKKFFFQAVEFANDDVLLSLLNNEEISVNTLNDNNRNALFYCISKGHIGTVKLLIKYGIDVDYFDNIETPLIHAVKLGEIKIAKELLKAGANVNGQDKNNRTALYAAIEKGNYNLVKLLIDHGIKITYFDKEKTPLIHAAMLGNERITKLLIDDGVKLNEVDDNCKTALHAAISSNNSNIVGLLIQKGININLYDGKSTTLLEAVKTKNEKIVQLIIDANPSLNDAEKYQIFENLAYSSYYGNHNTGILNILYKSSIPFEVNLFIKVVKTGSWWSICTIYTPLIIAC